MELGFFLNTGGCLKRAKLDEQTHAKTKRTNLRFTLDVATDSPTTIPNNYPSSLKTQSDCNPISKMLPVTDMWWCRRSVEPILPVK